MSAEIIPGCLPIAFVDVETTGTRSSRIVEMAVIGAVGGALEFEWSSLVDPREPLSPRAQALTGIDPLALQAAPSFAQLLPTLRARLAGRVLFAHNAAFDCRMLRAEVRRCGGVFAPSVVCTLRLSRRLFPQRRHHALDDLIAAGAGLRGERHRALSDARVLHDFWVELLQTRDAGELAAVLGESLEDDALPPHLPATLREELPETPGLFMLHDAGGALLYVARAADIRQGVLATCRKARRVARMRRLVGQTVAVRWQEFASVAAARMAESRLLAECRPPFNRASRGLTRIHWPQPAGEGV